MTNSWSRHAQRSRMSSFDLLLGLNNTRRSRKYSCPVKRNRRKPFRVLLLTTHHDAILWFRSTINRASYRSLERVSRKFAPLSASQVMSNSQETARSSGRAVFSARRELFVWHDFDGFDQVSRHNGNTDVSNGTAISYRFDIGRGVERSGDDPRSRPAAAAEINQTFGEPGRTLNYYTRVPLRTV